MNMAEEDVERREHEGTLWIIWLGSALILLRDIWCDQTVGVQLGKRNMYGHGRRTC